MTWDYKVMKFPVSGLFKPNVNASTLDQTLDQIGADGWELVSSTNLQTGNGATIEIVLIFKRPLHQTARTAKTPPPLP